MVIDYVVHAITPLLDVSSLSKPRITRVHILGPLVKIYSVLDGIDGLGICRMFWVDSEPWFEGPHPIRQYQR